MSGGLATLLLLFGCFSTISCLPGKVEDLDKYENSTDVSIYANIPQSPFTDEQIDQWIEVINEITADVETKMGAIQGLKRMKRSGDSSHWCCNKKDPQQIGPRQEVIRARVVQKRIPQGGSIKCGLFGLRRCRSSRTVIRTVTEYYIDYEYPLIPAPEWTNGCPEPNIVCCEGYAYYSNLRNCLTFQQLEDILVVVANNQDALFLLNQFLLGGSINK